MKIMCAYSEMVDVHKMQPNPKNPNKHPDRQIEMLAKIIDYQGQRSAIVVSNRSGFIVKGHGRLEAIKKLGWAQCAVDFQDYASEAQEFADLVADNKIAELAQSDDEMIKAIVMDFSELEYELFGLTESLEDMNFAPGGESDQQALDKLNPLFCKCPECGHAFDAKENELKD